MAALMSFVGVVLALWLAYTALPKLQKGWPRLTLLLLLLPVLAWSAFTIHSVYVRAVAACILLWVCPAKLLAIAMDTPIDTIPPGSFLQFAAVNLLPLRILGRSYSRRSSQQSFQIRHLLPLLQLAMMSISASFIHHNGQRISHWVTSAIYCIYIYSGLGVATAAVAKLAQLIARLEAAPSFNNPFVASSLSEFWGHRWNLVVTDMLRANVYDPIVGLLTPTKTESKSTKPNLVARSVATLASFLVSGLLHEAIFCCFNQSMHATWEETIFFVLHGVATVMEVFLRKRIFNDKLKLPRPASIFLTLGFMYITVDWLFLPPLTRTGSHAKLITEIYRFQSMVLDLFTFRFHSML